MIIWSAAIIGICAPLALRRFKTTSAARWPAYQPAPGG